jgi:hypothetical protein
VSQREQRRRGREVMAQRGRETERMGQWRQQQKEMVKVGVCRMT